ncbi:MAG: diguanylate cyclase [Deltaproteobacteria bacterium]|nr:diguanylate cyclase [Deltaproteobacteria bacterium]
MSDTMPDIKMKPVKDRVAGQDKTPLVHNVSIIARDTLKSLVLKNIPITPQNYKEQFEQSAKNLGMSALLELLPECSNPDDVGYDESAISIEKEKALSEMAEEAKKVMDEVMGVIESLKDRSIKQNKSLDDDVKKIERIDTNNAVMEVKKILIGELQKIQEDNTSLKRQLDETTKDLEDKKERLDKVNKMAVTDPLTQIPNRRSLDLRLIHEINRVKRYGGSLSIVFIDLDHFKKINDTYGHSVGDEVLIAFASLLQNHLRETDYAGRYGGEEFTIILPGTDRKGARIVAERIRIEMKEKAFMDKKKSICLKVTASFGITEYKDGDDGKTILERADSALYQAKETGRDRIEDI